MHNQLGTFVAYEVSLEVIESLRNVVQVIRQYDMESAKQIVRAASSVSANIAEGNRRAGKDRKHFFRIAAGSADETRAHLRSAVAWGWIEPNTIGTSLKLLDRQLGLLWGLTR